jgi:hypothetical protein
MLMTSPKSSMPDLPVSKAPNQTYLSLNLFAYLSLNLFAYLSLNPFPYLSLNPFPLGKGL